MAMPEANARHRKHANLPPPERTLATATDAAILWRRIATAPSLTQQEWDALVERWNGWPAIEREAQARACLHLGHDYAVCPVGCRVCRWCVKYVND